MSVGHVLDHMPDHVLDYIIIGLVIIALHLAKVPLIYFSCIIF